MRADERQSTPEETVVIADVLLSACVYCVLPTILFLNKHFFLNNKHYKLVCYFVIT